MNCGPPTVLAPPSVPALIFFLCLLSFLLMPIFGIFYELLLRHFSFFLYFKKKRC